MHGTGCRGYEVTEDVPQAQSGESRWNAGFNREHLFRGQDHAMHINSRAVTSRRRSSGPRDTRVLERILMIDRGCVAIWTGPDPVEDHVGSAIPRSVAESARQDRRTGYTRSPQNQRSQDTFESLPSQSSPSMESRATHRPLRPLRRLDVGHSARVIDSTTLASTRART